MIALTAHAVLHALTHIMIIDIFAETIIEILYFQ